MKWHSCLFVHVVFRTCSVPLLKNFIFANITLFLILSLRCGSYRQLLIAEMAYNIIYNTLLCK